MNQKTTQTKIFSTLITTLLIFSTSILFSIETQTSEEKIELIMKFKPQTLSSQKWKIVKAYGLTVVDQIPKLNLLTVLVPKNELSTVKEALKRHPTIEFFEENIRVSATQTPNDYYYSLQWHLQKIEMPNAWEITKGNQNIIVAILDTGVDVNHPDLSDKLLEGYNVYDGTGDVYDDVGHGTRVAGAAAAITNNMIGVSAPAWNNKILPVKVNIPGAASTTITLLAKGLTYAADKGAKVACLSWQIFNGSSTLVQAAKYFAEKGGIVIAAAGNTGKYEDYMDNPYIISVSATDKNDLSASFSSYGPYVDLSAPGVGILTTINGKEASSYDYAYGYASGTSFSAPITAGVVALMYSVNPSLTPGQITQILQTSAVDLGEQGYDFKYGWGRINATKALIMAAALQNQTKTPSDVNPPTVTILFPKEGAKVLGKITVQVDATDDNAVSKVELYIDEKLFATRTSSPYEFSWDTTAYANGAHSLKAKAYDTANNKAESNQITVNVDNTLQDIRPPTVKIIRPRNRATVSKTIQIEAKASDDTGISKIELYIDNILVATGNANLIYQWDTTKAKNGWHTITARATDLAGKTSTTTVRVYVNNKK
ncbi:MAG: S8 family serine peptidase [Candidatus Bathyarchaeia archaeon]